MIIKICYKYHIIDKKVHLQKKISKIIIIIIKTCYKYLSIDKTVHQLYLKAEIIKIFYNYLKIDKTALLMKTKILIIILIDRDL